LRALQDELARANEQLQNAPPRYRALAARQIAANEDALRRNARLLARAGAGARPIGP
jgi:hypothetical protein